MTTLSPTTRPLVLTDPVGQTNPLPNVLDRLALRFIADERDIPFFKLTLLLSVTVLPMGICLYVPALFSWPLAAVFLALSLGVYLGPYILMLHNTSHRPLLKQEYRWLSFWIPNVLGPFFGQSPGSYYVHHMGMHHPENNLQEDLSSTMRFQRDSLIDFLRYFGRFLTVGAFELSAYLWRKRRHKLLRQFLLGEVGFWVATAALLVVAPRATLVVFVIPVLVARFAMMAGNWAQHAFIDAASPENCYRNSITCINAGYNRRCFNDGYHIGHHLKANRHWTELPGELERNRETYAREGAIVFQGIDFFVIWFFLVTRNYDALARRYVQLGDRELSREEIISLLKERTKRIVAAPA